MDKRIFTNLSLQMSRIKYIGFDMDATLAIYKSPASEELAFNLAKKILVEKGYPKELESMTYDPAFPMRGAWFDKKYGNLLKTDEHCNIMHAWNGLNKLGRVDIRSVYPNKHVQLDEKRIFMLNTVFNTPEIYLLACTIHTLKNTPTAVRIPNKEAFSWNSKLISFYTIFNDCRAAIDGIHADGSYKSRITADLDRYIERDERAQATMQHLKAAGKSVFLLTNSDWLYTDKLMTFIMGSDWRTLFNVVIVSACKPAWFTSDRPFYEVDSVTGELKLGQVVGALGKDTIYSGGSVNYFRAQMGLFGKDTLYCGDHIIGDVLTSKQITGWRTLLVVPELDREMQIWSTQLEKFSELRRLSNNVHGQPKGGPINPETNQITDLTTRLESQHGAMGSIMRSGWKATHYAATIKRFADLYTGNVYNLLHYPSNHYFAGPIFMLPHETEVERNSSVDFKEMNESHESLQSLASETSMETLNRERA